MDCSRSSRVSIHPYKPVPIRAKRYVTDLALCDHEPVRAGSVGGDPFGGFLDGFHSFQSHEADGEVMRDGEGLRSISGPCLVVVFPVDGVADVVPLVLDSPVLPGDPVDAGCSYLLRDPAGG